MRCDICFKAGMSGNNVSHSNRHTKTRFFANVHKQTLFHDGKAIIAYGVNNLGAQQVIENTYAMDYEEVARKNGFQRSAQHGNPMVSKAKWYEGFNRVQIAPLEWLYQEAKQSLQVSDFNI